MERHHTSPLATAHARGARASARFVVGATARATTEAMAGAGPLTRTAGFEEFPSRNGAARHRYERLAGDGNAAEASPRPSFACGYFLAPPSRQRTLRAGIRWPLFRTGFDSLLTIRWKKDEN